MKVKPPTLAVYQLGSKVEGTKRPQGGFGEEIEG
jgi:hypothetical protein